MSRPHPARPGSPAAPWIRLSSSSPPRADRASPTAGWPSSPAVPTRSSCSEPAPRPECARPRRTLAPPQRSAPGRAWKSPAATRPWLDRLQPAPGSTPPPARTSESPAPNPPNAPWHGCAMRLDRPSLPHRQWAQQPRLRAGAAWHPREATATTTATAPLASPDAAARHRSRPLRHPAPSQVHPCRRQGTAPPPTASCARVSP